MQVPMEILDLTQYQYLIFEEKKPLNQWLSQHSDVTHLSKNPAQCVTGWN